MSKQVANSGKIDKKTLDKVYWRNIFGLQLGWNYEKMQGLGYCYILIPVLRILYGHDQEKLIRALKRHLGFFNTAQAMSNLIVGANIALEEELGEEAEETVVALKTGMMGPFAGIGDTIFIAIYRAIVFSIASYIALDGNAVGLIIPIITGIIVLWARYKFTYLGYKQGTMLATGFADSMQLLTEGASILGLTVVGALIPSVVSYRLNLSFAFGEVALNLQEMLDKILPGLVPLGIVFLSYWLLGKKKMNSTRLIWVLIALGMVLGNLQTFINWATAVAA